MQADTATSMSTNRGAHEESYPSQNATQSSGHDLPISSALNLSVKSADDARSSISSDKSDSKPPRSAMRRTSSISKIPQSPRRVRFDFMGEEVLPTSSPQQSAVISARISSPEPLDDEADCASHLATDPGEDEEETTPSKVSSSDALRALSRMPYDEDGTVWTVVNSDSDGSASDDSQPTQGHPIESTEVSSNSGVALISSPGIVPGTNTLQAHLRLMMSPAHSTTAHGLNDIENDSTDEEDFLSMAKRKPPLPLRQKMPQQPLSPLNSAKENASSTLGRGKRETMLPSTSGTNASTSRAAEVLHNALPDSVEMDDDLFFFEDEGLEMPSRAIRIKSVKQAQEQPDEETSDHETDDAPIVNILYATSPPVAIPRQMGPEVEEPKFNTGTVGSYKGRPLMMAVIRNPDVLENIHSSTSVNPVVGSVHNQSPIDDFNPSIRQSSIDERLAANAPRSFRERLMLEEMMEAEKETQRTSGERQL